MTDNTQLPNTTREQRRYAAVQADITRLLDQAANDTRSGGMIGLGAVWLASEMYARNEQARLRAESASADTKTD